MALLLTATPTAVSLAAAGSAADRLATPSVAPPRPHPVATLYRQALVAAERQDWPQYLDLVERALVMAPGHPGLQRRRAEALTQMGRLDEAMAILDGMADWGVTMELDENELLAPLRQRADWPALSAAVTAALRPCGGTSPSFTAPADDLVPEGLAYDPVDDVFYLSSVAQRKIVRVDRAGRATDFIAPGEHGYLAGLGLAIDAPRRRLWAVSTAAPDDGRFDAATTATSALHVFDLTTGDLLWSFTTAQADSQGFNDVCVLPDGGAAVSVSDRGMLLRCTPGGEGLLPLTVPNTLPGANGLCVGPGGDCLYVSAYGLGIMRVDLMTGDVGPAAVADGDFTTVAVDGLYASPDGSLIAVQNARGLDRVARFTLDTAGFIVGCTPLVSRQPVFDEPTTGALAPDGFHFIADSYVSPFFERADKSVLTGFGRSKVVRVRVG